MYKIHLILNQGGAVSFDSFSNVCVKDQNSKHVDEHREVDDTSEKMSPNKNLKSPQKGSKRLKTTPFKVTLLDSAEFEGEIEVWIMENNLW